MKKTPILLFFLLAFTIFNATAQSEKYYAAFIYNFTKNMNWDASKRTGDFVIAVIGNSGVTPYLEQLAASKTVGTQKIVVKTVNSTSSDSGAHLIFLPKNQNGQLSSAIASSNKNKALLVTEKPGSAKQRAAMNFIDNGGRVGFEINKKALSSAKIQINAKLESLGKVVG